MHFTGLEHKQETLGDTGSNRKQKEAMGSRRSILRAPLTSFDAQCPCATLTAAADAAAAVDPNGPASGEKGEPPPLPRVAAGDAFGERRGL